MKDIYELIKEYNSLIKGNVYKKIINGKEYYYHQYSINGVKSTHIVKKDEYEELLHQVSKRKALHEEIKQLEKSTKRNLILSDNARNLTGDVMNKDEIVATFNNGELTYINADKCPLIICKNKRLEPFLKTRSIDSGRTNSRLLKKVLNIKESDSELISLCSYAASISDNYWFRPKNSKMHFENVAFDSDLFFNTSLKGLITIYPNKIILTPELTTNGSYEKGWKNIDGEWWLYKLQNKEEIYSELFYSRLFEYLKLKTAHYEYEDGYIKTKNFANGLNFEPVIGIAGDDDSYINVYKALNNINHDLAKEYMLLTFFDVVLNNIDRHNENCGLLRDPNSGKILSLAPNYDNNLCLISRNINLDTSINEGFLKAYASDINKYKELKETLKEIDIPLIDEKTLDEVIKQMPFEYNNKMIKDFIMNRYRYLISVINK